MVWTPGGAGLSMIRDLFVKRYNLEASSGLDVV